ncbi:helix-turn-helix transcriptional regulator [Cohnella hongkongensis]|uniref:Helix-turn-helix transcriptional regulator n=1 Tax=Cohnella hongkongensis TaxID=178337 RepID=A0ABV9FFT1_9BACL
MNRYWRKYRGKKYLLRLVLSINLLLVTFMIVSLLAAFLYAEKISLASQREANQKVLSQMNYNIAYMNETVKNLAISIFYDNDMAQLLYSGKPDEHEDWVRINKLNKTIGYNSFLHSIVIYNSKQDTYFISGEVPEKSSMIGMVGEYLDGKRTIHKMQLMPDRFAPDPKHPERQQDVFSLYLYDSLDAYTRTESAVIVNIRPEWLFQQVELMNNLPANRSSTIVLFDQKQAAYSAAERSDLDLSHLKGEVYRHLAASHDPVSQFTYTYGDQKQIVNYMINPSIDWVIVDIQPYEAVMASIRELKLVFTAVAAVCLALALLVSLFVSRKLYAPIDVLMKQAKRMPGGEADNGAVKDEISYMSHVYDRLVDKLTREHSKRERNEEILIAYYLRKLVTDSTAFSPDDWRQLQEGLNRKGIRANLEKDVVVVVFQIDRQLKKEGAKEGAEVRLLHFAVSNIVLDMMAEQAEGLRGEVADIRGENLVMLFDAESVRADRLDAIAELLRRAGRIVRDYYRVTFTCALSDAAPTYREITYQFRNALDSLAYRRNFGAGAVITPEMVRRNLNNGETQVPTELERKLVEAIKLSSRDAVYDGLNRIREALTAMNADATMQSVIQLSLIVKQTLREMNRNKLAPLPIDLRAIDRAVFELETLDEIFAALSALLDGLFIDHRQVVENKDHVLVDTIKDVIHANYANVNLCLQDIAEMLKMSAAYIGRIFKKYEAVSVAEYINEYRLQQSLHYLEKNKVPIAEVVEKVGFNSQSYFFKMFKKRFGATPKEYRVKKSLT